MLVSHEINALHRNWKREGRKNEPVYNLKAVGIVLSLEAQIISDLLRL